LTAPFEHEVALLRRRPGKWLAVALLAMTGLGAGAAAVVSSMDFGDQPPEFLMRFRKLVPAQFKAQLPKLAPEQLTASLRKRGYHECNPHDPIGLGPYDPYRTTRARGRLLIPQKGGHTPDMGFDVLIHFHGGEPVRKTLVQVARGVTFVGIDLGINSGPYMKAYQSPGTFQVLRDSIEENLRDKTGDPRAHIRNLGLSAWSAGYGAVNEILKLSDPGVDSVALLDGLHAGFDPAFGGMNSRRPLSGLNIEPILDFARQAQRGEKLFVFTHSEVDPVTYPSTKRTADFVLSQLGIPRTAAPESNLPFALTSRAEQSGFHVWAYTGGDTKAHCEHITFIAPIVRDLIEPRWDTPPMDRNVPFNKAPKLGTPKVAEPAEPSESTEPSTLSAAINTPSADANSVLSPESGG